MYSKREREKGHLLFCLFVEPIKSNRMRVKMELLAKSEQVTNLKSERE